MLQDKRELLMTYRLYFMDRAGHFVGLRQVEADDEARLSSERNAWDLAKSGNCGTGKPC